MTDPKPNLSRAGIEANINYYAALEQRYSQQYREALYEHTYWLRELQKLSSTDNQGVTPEVVT
jgi:hypothetical protein